MANPKGFPGKHNKVYPDPVPRAVAKPAGRASPGRSMSAPKPGSVSLRRDSASPKRAQTNHPSTPMGARKQDAANPTWDAPVSGAPQPGKKGHP